MSDDTSTPTPTDVAPAPAKGSRLDRLRAELEQAKTAAKAASSVLSDEDRDEIELRQKIADANAEREQVELEQRELDLDRRFDAAKEAFPDQPLKKLLIESYPDTFILKHNRAAYARWEDETAKSVSNKRLKRPDIFRRWAVAMVIDWNGKDLSDPLKSGAELDTYLTQNPGIVTAITNAGGELAGVVGKARKS